MKIGIYPVGGKSWMAGITLLKGLLYALKHTYRNEVRSYLVCSQPQSATIPSELTSIADGILVFPYLRRRNPLWIGDYIAKRLFSRNLKEEIFLKQNKIDVIFGLAIPYAYGNIPLLSWVWDFQHLHLPEMFSLKERAYRDRLFSKTAKVSSRIIVMSESVKKDFLNFVPHYAYKVRIIQHPIYIPKSIYRMDPQSILTQYNLPEKFIYLPNQFWKHKNHEIAFCALKKLKDKGTEITLVCSGHSNDYRHPNHFVDLFQKVSKWDIGNQVIYLGMIPHEHVLLLMRQSICVLNPSLFEGFGLTVYEAAMLGKQILLSDIPAHREQKLSRVTFFNPHNVDDLGEKMDTIWQQARPGPDVELEEKGCKNFPELLDKTAKSFVAVVKEVL